MIPELCHLIGVNSNDKRNNKELHKIFKNDYSKLAMIKQTAKILQSGFDDRKYPIKMEITPLKLIKRTLQTPKVRVKNKSNRITKYDDKTNLYLTQSIKNKRIKIKVISHDKSSKIICNQLEYYIKNEQRWKRFFNYKIEKIVLYNYDAKKWINNIKYSNNEPNYHGIMGLILVLPTDNHNKLLATKIFKETKTVFLNDNKIITQCVKADNISKKIVIQKLLNNILNKYGEIPWDVYMDTQYISLNNIMFVGLDVCHSKAFGMSTIGFTSTTNYYMNNFYHQIMYQKMGMELVPDILILIKNSLAKYKAVNDSFPDSIVYFRDGVSQGQIKLVKDVEITKIMAVLKKIGVELIVVICQKRIATRFYGNIQFGVVVDGYDDKPTIVSGIDEDFYIVSAGVPTRYWIVYDSNMGIIKNKDKVRDMQNVILSRTMMYYDFAGGIKVPSVIKHCDRNAFKFSDKDIRNKIKDKLDNDGILHLTHLKDIDILGTNEFGSEFDDDSDSNDNKFDDNVANVPYGNDASINIGVDMKTGDYFDNKSDDADPLDWLESIFPNMHPNFIKVWDMCAWLCNILW